MHRGPWTLFSIVFIFLVLMTATHFLRQYHNNEDTQTLCPVTHYSKKLLYLHCNREKFGTELNDLLQKSELPIKLIIPDGTGIYGVDRGYWVIFE